MDKNRDGVDALGSVVRVVGDRRADHLRCHVNAKRAIQTAEEAGESSREEAAVAPQVRDCVAVPSSSCPCNHAETDVLSATIATILDE